MITGGSSGIGYAIAERFLQEGADRVIVVGRSYERLIHAATRLQRATSVDEGLKLPDGEVGTTRVLEEEQQNQKSPAEAVERTPGSLVPASDRISLLVGDVSEASSWVRELEKAMQNVDILVNAAGISISNILPKQEPADISRTLRTNLEGAMLTSRALLRASIRSRLRRRNDSDGDDGARPASKCIINISSLLAVKGGTGAVPYAASKAGLLGLTRSLSVEAASSLRDVVVRSNAIVPGYIETPMIADFSGSETNRLKESIPLRRFGQPHEIADAAVFLARNEYANNCVLNLDGGLSAV
ncbi:SDR family NAD(P)-dependent oxidoreductase [Aspergillus melleus]|uniref:SDR family NAD(P)-dependent oxidoreductase n=1 Tax=Aspergillus melleus TaxID=138277 RepID=UPI001E8E0E40|nr:uncharacterized protein LDX57_002758 [Aspergillus melleus]KAH8425012.1 hypothetical protein LDX57_002758 [Aspergillus melleus]